MSAPAWPPVAAATDWEPTTPVAGKHHTEHNSVAAAVNLIAERLGPDPAPVVVSSVPPPSPSVGMVWIDTSGAP